MNRHRAREQAFNIIFEKLFNEDVQTEKLFELGVAEGLFEEDEFSISLAGLTESKSGEIDKLIEENSIGWRLSRLPKVSLAVLRLAVCEMLYIE
ncbi:MAG TPA: transcription antitermination factor NusB, partial [Clostridiales bacterium]|nr:transcription antitermination factor NusB [Clostridiales bacterium]